MGNHFSPTALATGRACGTSGGSPPSWSPMRSGPEEHQTPPSRRCPTLPSATALNHTLAPNFVHPCAGR